jgi:hypothetical protein
MRRKKDKRGRREKEWKTRRKLIRPYGKIGRTHKRIVNILKRL